MVRVDNNINLGKYSFVRLDKLEGEIGEVNCISLTEKECRELNNRRDLATLDIKTIEVGLELRNGDGKLIRFNPRYVTFVTRQ